MHLPATVPLFPLPNAVLFPGVPLKLHVFEPRYREMVREVDHREERLIGIVLLRGDWRRDYYGAPDVFPIGCAGRMVDVKPLHDGRYDIVLHGVREFTIIGERRDRAFREAEVRWRPAAPEQPVRPELRARLHALLHRLIEEQEPKLIRLLNDGSLPDEVLINHICCLLGFSPLERQGLLEAPDLEQRASRLCDVVQFALEARARGTADDKWYH